MPSVESEENKLREIIKESTTGEERAALIFQLTKLMVAVVEEKRAAAQTARAQTTWDNGAAALGLLRSLPDGERLIARAYRADPRATSIELNYLGGAPRRW